jgi:hypothetical protein
MLDWTHTKDLMDDIMSSQKTRPVRGTTPQDAILVPPSRLPLSFVIYQADEIALKGTAIASLIRKQHSANRLFSFC